MSSEGKAQVHKAIAYWVDSARCRDWKALSLKDFGVFGKRIRFLIETERINILLKVITIDPLFVYDCIAESGRCDILEQVIEKHKMGKDFILVAIRAAWQGQLGIIMRLMEEVDSLSEGDAAAMFRNARMNATSPKCNKVLKDNCFGVMEALRGWYPDIEKWVSQREE